MLEITNQHLPHREQLRTTTIQSEHDHAKAAFERGVLVKVVDHNLGDRISLQFQNNPNRFIRLISRVTDSIQLFLFDQFSHPFDQLFRVHIVRNLGDHQLLFSRATVLNRNLAP